MSHDVILRTKVSVTSETLVRRLLRVFDAATEAERDAGAVWYDVAGGIAESLGEQSGYGKAHAAAVISHLSPRFRWPRNVAAAAQLLLHGERLPGVIQRSYAAAIASLSYDDPGQSFSGPKTQRFYRNLMGDHDVVTVDVWAARAAGVSENQLYRVGVYDAIEHAYRKAARRRGVSPATMQATTWVAARGGRSDLLTESPTGGLTWATT